MRELTLVVADDQPVMIQLLEKLCNDHGGIRFLHGFTSPLEARSFLAENHVDIVILDIEMPEMTGLELASALHSSTKLIFSTSHQEFAMEAFDLSATDYLLKPYTYERFAFAIDKAIRVFRLEENSGIEKAAAIALKTNHMTVHVAPESISHIESIDNYCIIYRKNEEPLKVRKPLKLVLEDLPAGQFLRIHRSYVVQTSHITGYQKTKIFIENKEFPLSASYRNIVLRAIADSGKPKN